jgi:hypothetical protein
MIMYILTVFRKRERERMIQIRTLFGMKMCVDELRNLAMVLVASHPFDCCT